MEQRISNDPGRQRQIRSRYSPKRRKRAKRSRILQGILVPALLAILILSAVMIAKGLRKDELKGVWTLDQTTVYEFNGRGSGTLRLPLNDYGFTYTIQGDSLSIDFEEEKASDAIYRFSVDGSVLTLVSDTGSVFRFEKEK